MCYNVFNQKNKEELIMTQLQFNLNLEEIKDVLVKSNIDEFAKASLVIILNDYMQKERDRHINASSYERSDNRQDYRNGYYTRELLLSIGRIELRVPRTRNGDFHTDVFEKYQRTEKSLLLTILDMYLKGISTRNVTKVIKTLNNESISKSMVSSLTKTLQEELEVWNSRDLSDIDYCPYLYLDATYIKVREGNKVISKAIYVAQGLNDKGRRSILGLKIDAGEDYDVWRDFIVDLKRRNLAIPRMVISDAHEGLKKAIEREFNGASWQRCTVHFKRNLIGTLPLKNTDEIRYDLKNIFEEINPHVARKSMQEFVKKYEDNPKYQKLIRRLEDGFEDAIQYMSEPIVRQRYIRSTNSLERINGKIKARTKIIKIFPNDNSAFRIAASILLDSNEEQMHKDCLF